jgi:hypothetical protein
MDNSSNTDPRAMWIKRLADAWKPAPPVANNVDEDEEGETALLDGRRAYISQRIADAAVRHDSRVVQLHDSVGPSTTLPTTGAALRQIREQRKGVAS